ncbi:MAG: YkvA family protein [Leadbetterella sp.]
MDFKNLLNTILSSNFYTNSIGQASRLGRNTVGMLNLLKKVLEVLQKEGKSSLLNNVSKKLMSMVDLVKSYASGKYKEIELKNIILVLGGFIYLVSPFDLIPDVLPVLGFTDDIALITFIYNALMEEIEKYELWVENNKL